MSLYANYTYTDGERQAIEVATVKGWSDFVGWVKSLPEDFTALHELVSTGEHPDTSQLHADMQRAWKPHRPQGSALDVAKKLGNTLPDEGKVSISDEPEDDELDGEETT